MKLACALVLCCVLLACAQEHGPEKIYGKPLSAFGGAIGAILAVPPGMGPFSSPESPLPGVDLLNVSGTQMLLVRALFNASDANDDIAAEQFAHAHNLSPQTVFCVNPHAFCVVVCESGDCLFHDARGTYVIGEPGGLLPNPALSSPLHFIFVREVPQPRVRTRLPGSEQLTNIALYVENGHTYDALGRELPLDPATEVVLSDWLVKDRTAVYYVMHCTGNSCPTTLVPLEGADPATFRILPQAPMLDRPRPPYSSIFAEDKSAVYNSTVYTTTIAIDRIAKTELQCAALTSGKNAG